MTETQFPCNSMSGVGEMICTTIERHSNRTAFVFGGTLVSYKEFGEQVSKVLQLFKEMGLKPGARVMQLSANRHEIFVVMAACFVGGYASVVPQYKGGPEDHRFILNDCSPSVLLVDGAFAQRGKELAQGSIGTILFCYDDIDGLEHFWRRTKKFEAAPLAVTAKPDDVIRIAYTGGTTGRPKGVLGRSSAMAFASLLHVSAHDFSCNTRFLLASPISHAAGSFILPVLWKGGAVLIEETFNADRVFDAIEKQEATAFFAVPTMLYALIDHPRAAKTNYGGMERIVYAGSPIAADRLEQAMRLFGSLLSQIYGQSEAPGTILYLAPEDHVVGSKRLASVGRPFPCVAVTILDNEDRELPCGPQHIGEVCVRAPHVMKGYLNQPSLTPEVMRGGWLHTGDMAFKDEDGYFYLVDRKKDMIISGGFNIYPQEVEMALCGHEAVAHAAVIGVPHPKWGEEVKAFVVLRPGGDVTASEIMAYIKGRKGSIQTPKSIEFVKELPLTPVGKVDKKALRKPFWEGLTRSIN